MKLKLIYKSISDINMNYTGTSIIRLILRFTEKSVLKLCVNLGWGQLLPEKFSLADFSLFPWEAKKVFLDPPYFF